MLLGASEDDAVSDRHIYLNDPLKNATQKFLHNSITTGKYNFATFLPKFFYEQFSKYANLFFLFTAIIQQIGDLSPTNKFGTVIPLSIVLVASAVKEIMEDMKRHSQDAETNARSVKVLSGSQFIPKQWRHVVAGDIVRVENGQFFPADLILLSSSEPDALCYIETSNLDGETNLKIRQGLPETANYLTPEDVAKLEGVIKSEQPNNSLYTYEGTLRLGSKEIPLDPAQLLLRGAMLRNTRWIYGVVVFTGHETKLMKNATATPIKRTKVERLVNTEITFLFVLLVALAVTCALGALGRQLGNPFEREVLLLDPGTAWARFPGNILTYIILFNNLIPLSLIVTMELVKYILGAFINQDADMYHEESNSPAMARTSSLVEELGQIDYIFSDKTGTLTCNVMEYRMCTIAGIAYAEVVPEDKRVRVDENGKEVGYWDFQKLKHNEQNHATAPVIQEFMRLLAVCHTVIPEANEETGEINFQASSPDEGALVKGAQKLGWAFTTRRPRSVMYSHNGQSYEYEVLNICEFNSTRKRMSAVVRGPDGKIKLYVKGADTVILERLAQHNPYVETTCANLEDYANEGLRTLCIAYRDVSNEEYAEWSKIYEKAATTINNRGAELDKAAELIEKELFLLGATAIEDRLQDEVPDTIHTLAQAGIKLWVLTGDRQETAINIGYSCKLITEEMSLIVCNQSTHFETKEFLLQKLNAVRASVSGAPIAPVNDDYGFGAYVKKGYAMFGFERKAPKMSKDSIPEAEPLALVIDGRTLEYALEDDIKFTFLALATMCKAVICCRVSPLQKALVVKLVKKNVADCVTLAIGDGANDVSMIQAAHVGIGISGMEGLQAARAADFAIAQFRFLKKLLLVHGGWAYSRMSKLVLYSFYKNITLYLIQLWFTKDNGFSGQTLFETWTQAAYNIIFAVFQPIAIGIFDQYVYSRTLERYPQLYRLGQTGEFYNHNAFWAWIINSFFHSLLMYYLMHAVYGEGVMLGLGGYAANIWIFGEMIYTTDLITITLKAAITCSTWVKFTHIAVWGSIGVWFFLFPIYATVAPMIGVARMELQGMMPFMFGAATFWWAIILVPLVANLRDFTWKFFKRQALPRSYQIVQEIQKYNIQDHRPRAEVFRKAVTKVRQFQRVKRNRGFAFSQNESGQAALIRLYDTTRRKPRG
ncbi:phospholipid-translocating P-type ATPase, flippase [Spizellomyces punctatus DAOM BR117]|uniref:Phospholipid-transporting ATPase n=1 Tax=Spizellomyces punctatus (strain DAOM BR117) TaxID=645134 RepID=A0A0L0HFX2_SPIPD|nr:phospholipid-translocating P-type ATPase, flippase [Spizellomyces punctatus DAOM BR117]KNC99972.1 phospholipid-translocating P-type ATPase, flippase [Spizellomyces punctatus DAOM BR117]|eukprot:XP_016608012.1 phospholipid-translocating P-type ATPase, flippase [Spizellomyces punctatus DAOM BR117]